MAREKDCMVVVIWVLSMSCICWGYDWTIGVENVVPFSDFMLTPYDLPGPGEDYWGPDEDQNGTGDWGEDGKWATTLLRGTNSVLSMVQRNGEDVDKNPLTLSLALPNGQYEIIMNNVTMHGSRNGGGGEYLVTALAEGIDISAVAWHDQDNQIEIPLAIGDNSILVYDGRLDIVLGNCYTTPANMGCWFSFEGFRLKQTTPEPVTAALLASFGMVLVRRRTRFCFKQHRLKGNYC